MQERRLLFWKLRWKGGKTMAGRPSCRCCAYCNSAETYGYKYYCEWYKIYVDPDDCSECPHFRN